MPATVLSADAQATSAPECAIGPSTLTLGQLLRLKLDGKLAEPPAQDEDARARHEARTNTRSMSASSVNFYEVKA